MQTIIATVDKVLFEGEAAFVICPGIEGELTVLPNHTALVTPLKAGDVRVRAKDGHDETFAVERGILEVSNNKATILL